MGLTPMTRPSVPRKSEKSEVGVKFVHVWRTTVLLPVQPWRNNRIAVKIVDDRGIESLKVMEVERSKLGFEI
jgi:adenine-specific DNA-methyltransferase